MLYRLPELNFGKKNHQSLNYLYHCICINGWGIKPSTFASTFDHRKKNLWEPIGYPGNIYVF
jgi:hypothetical protein